ncbi:MAG: hypothetical protein UW87_C0026G0009 [Candidatus Moranbacteria bacterium GW2011_GWC2_45_10]|nr:MAG: hypothetical protein UW87_C0026G0009 [Candidatus Moranbacteria bacterium GW2011_GWC2_45_10]
MEFPFRGIIFPDTDFGGATLPVPPTVSLSANPSTILLESGESFTSLPPAEKNVTLTWTISGGSATSCTAECVLGDCGTWMTDTNKSTISGSTESVAVTSTVTDFKITCTGPGGSSSSTANVSSLCYEHSCAANACAESVKFGIADYATGCSVQACSSDTQCESRSTGEWREVAP